MLAASTSVCQQYEGYEEYSSFEIFLLRLFVYFLILLFCTYRSPTHLT